MIFTRLNIERIRGGKKIETRRIWKRPHVRVGGVYRVRSSRRVRADPEDPLIRVLSICKERLADMPIEAYALEGVPSVREFVDQWIELHGHWDLNEVVTVVRFEVVPE